MKTSRRHRFAAILGLLAVMVSWLVPMAANAGPRHEGRLPACCSHPASKRCCAGECCMARSPVPGSPTTPLPPQPGASIRIAPDWVPAFLALITSSAVQPPKATPPLSSRSLDRAPRLPLFLRDAALLI